MSDDTRRIASRDQEERYRRIFGPTITCPECEGMGEFGAINPNACSRCGGMGVVESEQPDPQHDVSDDEVKAAHFALATKREVSVRDITDDELDDIFEILEAAARVRSPGTVSQSEHAAARNVFVEAYTNGEVNECPDYDVITRVVAAVKRAVQTGPVMTEGGSQ